MAVRDLLIIGAGPSGLSAAIAAKQRGLDYQVLERGALVNSIFNFPPQMVFFTTPELLEIGGLPFVSPYDKPTRAEHHHGSTTQGGSNYGQGSNDIGRQDANRQGSESNSGSNYGNEKKKWVNEALRRKDITGNRQDR